MVQAIVRTKYHRLLELIDDDQIYLSAPGPGSTDEIGVVKHGTAAHYTDYGFKKDAIRWIYSEPFAKLPKFVFDQELIQLVTDLDYHESVMAMKEAGVMRLPFPAMIVEFRTKAGHHAIIMIRDCQEADHWYEWEPPGYTETVTTPFYAMKVIIHKDEGGEYAVLSPGVIGLDIKRDETGIVIGMTATGLDEFIVRTADRFGYGALLKNTFRRDAGQTSQGLFSALVLMSVKGIGAEIVDVARLNRKRQQSGKPSIPHHTYIHIKRVFRSASSDVSDEYTPRRSPIPHLRRGHNREVHYGPRSEGKSRLHYFPPKLVAYTGGPLPAPTYIVKK